MSTINKIANQVLLPKTNIEKASNKEDNIQGPSFGSTVSNFLKAVNEAQISGKEAVGDVITGKTENLHEVMAKVEESKLSFELMLEIRNKLLESFQQIQRMQV